MHESNGDTPVPTPPATPTPDTVAAPEPVKGFTLTLPATAKGMRAAAAALAVMEERDPAPPSLAHNDPLRGPPSAKDGA